MFGTTKLAVFFHIAHLGHWDQIWRAMEHEMWVHKLLDNADVYVKNDCQDIALFEFPTLDMLHAFCKNNDNYYVLYLHTKGVTRPYFKPMDDWRDCMIYFNVEHWRDCCQKLDEGFDSVGVSTIQTPGHHYQGNFWWAKSSYIRTLQPVEDMPDLTGRPSINKKEFGNRHKCEMWVLSNPECKVFSPYHWHIDPYQVENPRSNYENQDYVWNINS
jgi:hypothetical protein